MNYLDFLKKTLSGIIGGFILAFVINTLFIPHQLLSGGISGIAAFIQIVTGFEASITVILFNIPIFILGYFLINKKFIAHSLVGMASLSVFLYLTRNLPSLTDDLLVAVIAGGILGGIGSGIIFRVNTSQGGSDILAKIANKHFSVKMGTCSLILNTIVLLLSLTKFSIDLAVYTFIAMFITATVNNYVVEGLSFKRSVLIITKNPNEITSSIRNKLKRGSTIIDARGGYTNAPVSIVYTTISPRQVAKLKLLVRDIDERAFMTVTDASYVLGNGRGFSQMKNIDE